MLGVSIDAASGNRTTPLWEAASNGHIRIVQFLVEKGADVNAFDARGNTPLYIALSRKEWLPLFVSFSWVNFSFNFISGCGGRWPTISSKRELLVC